MKALRLAPRSDCSVADRLQAFARALSSALTVSAAATVVGATVVDAAVAGATAVDAAAAGAAIAVSAAATGAFTASPAPSTTAAAGTAAGAAPAAADAAPASCRPRRQVLMNALRSSPLSV